MSATSGVGMPAALWLDEFGALCGDFFGCHVYQVGSSICSKASTAWRDVDVRAMLDDAVYEKLGLGDPEHTHHNRAWVALTLAFSALGKQMTGLPIDFQVQQATWANARYNSKDGHTRSALGIVALMRRNSNTAPDLLEPVPTPAGQGVSSENKNDGLR